MSKVYLLPARRLGSREDIEVGVTALWRAAGLAGCFKKNDLTALKLHVGEPGIKTYVNPAIAAALVKCVSSTGARPFLTDTAVLYKSPRDNGPGHAGVAERHGFGYQRTGAHFVPADGLIGADEIDVDIYEKHFESVSIAAGIVQARSMLVLSHATGHLATGLGAALKNLGMGCVSRKAKLRQHSGQLPRIKKSACIVCGECARWCPVDAIEVTDKAAIDPDRCIGCGECVAVCRESAVAFDWGTVGQELQERIVEHALGALQNKTGSVAYVTSAMTITKDCDCLGVVQEGLVDDIGLLASTDPVAIDRAVLDLIKARSGKTLESMSYPQNNAEFQLTYAEKLGLGRNKYELIEIQD